jgi:EAL domain-containing protein (putative c-di-GMP-specific phosphodiesterase class I)
VARWGGDEFIAILKNSDDLAKIREAIQKILESLEQPFHINNRTFYLKTSIGISLYPQDGTDQDTLLKHADSALYRSKEQGKAQYKFYTTTMTSKALNYLNLENLLHQALEKKELLLYYQPQINVETGKVTTMEALLRWQQSQLGMIYPDEFIPLAEDSRLIIPIGEWVMRTACQQTKIWQEAGFDQLSISVNINYQQLSETAFIEMVLRNLQQTGLEAKYLELEITETSLIQNMNLVNDIIQNLQNKGVRIALDDFGVGYSSLNYLKQISFNILKLDKCFMKNIAEETSRELAIISVIMILANKLDLTVICEGVETQQQLDILLSTLPNMQKFYVQGYFYSKPLSVEDATNFLHNHYK